MSGTILRRRDRTARSLRVVHYSSAVNMGVTLNTGKTRIVHVRHGFEFLGYKIKQGRRPLRLQASKITSGVRGGACYAVPREKSIRHFKDQIRQRTRRKTPVSTQELIDQINPVIRGWGQY